MKYLDLTATLKTINIEIKKTIETQIEMSQMAKKLKRNNRKNRSLEKNRDRNKGRKERIEITGGNRRTQR